jgi:hypothetical protein
MFSLIEKVHIKGSENVHMVKCYSSKKSIAVQWCTHS